MTACFQCSPRTQMVIGLGLVALMWLTRLPYFGNALHLADASWAVFFIAGFYLAPLWFGVLLVQAVAIDVLAVGWMGVADYCLTPAYAALQLAHAALWLGGRWLRGHAHLSWRGVPALMGAVAGSGLVAFALSNGSFYWLGGRVASPNWAQFMQTWVDYAPGFIGVMALYVAVVALMHVYATTLANHPRRA